MTLTLARAGDTMLGRGVGERLCGRPDVALLDSALVELCDGRLAFHDVAASWRPRHALPPTRSRA